MPYGCKKRNRSFDAEVFLNTVDSGRSVSEISHEFKRSTHRETRTFGFLYPRWQGQGLASSPSKERRQ